MTKLIISWTASSEFCTYRQCEQRRFRRACASAQSRQNLRCSLIQAVNQEEPSDSQIPAPSEWPGMRSWNLSWLNARRHKFAWRGSVTCPQSAPIKRLYQYNNNDNNVFIWASSRKSLSSGFPTMWDSTRPVQPQKVGRGLRLWI